MKEIKRYVIPPSENQITNAFKQALITMKSIGSKNIILLTPTRSIEDTEIEDFFGQKTKSLIKNKYLSFSEGILLKHETLQTFHPASASNTIIIGVYASKKMLDLIDDSKLASSVIIVPGLMDSNIENWIMTWSPDVFGQEKEDFDKLIDSCIVEKALESLTSFLTHSGGVIISGKPDKEVVAQIFKKLKENGEFYDPVSIRNWAIKNGWKTKGADELMRISQAVLDGKGIHSGKSLHWRKDIIDQFRKECENSD